MRVLVFGATGGTGRQLVRQALRRGHAVIAFARRPDAVPDRDARLTIVQGDVLDPRAVDQAVAGADAVLSALGTPPWSPGRVLSGGTQNIVVAMQRRRVYRLVCQTSLGIGDSKGELGWPYNYILIPLLLRRAFAEKERQERQVQESGLDWILVRPGTLTNGRATGRIWAWLPGEPHPKLPVISRADVAGFMLDQLASATYLRKAVGIAGAPSGPAGGAPEPPGRRDEVGPVGRS